MSLSSQDEVFLCALKKNPGQRTQQDLELIYSRLHRFEALCNLREQKIRNLAAHVRYERHSANEILYGKDDLCTCWFILLSGSIFIQGSMFLRNTSFGRKIPGMKRRGTQCLVLEPSEMMVIDYEMDQIVGGQHDSSDSSGPNVVNRKILVSVTDESLQSVEVSPGGIFQSKNSKLLNDQSSTSQSESVSIASRESWDSSQEIDFIGRERGEDSDGDVDDTEEQEDSISLHSSSSVIKDLVIDALKKDLSERNEDDNDALCEFTRSLQAFSNMTELTRRKLCKFMVFAQVDKAGSVLLQDNELLDSWSVIINGSVQISFSGIEEDRILGLGESFGVKPNIQPQHHKGAMFTLVDECQFVCIAQQHYFEVISQEKENMDYIFGDDGSLKMVKEKREAEGGRKGDIVIRGTAASLHEHLLEENSTDNTYAEDFLLTYRAFWNEPRAICDLLLKWFEKDVHKGKITRVILLWVNNHFNDFEEDSHMMNLLEKFEERLRLSNKSGECRLFNIACSTKAKPRVIKISRLSNEEDLGIELMGGKYGYPIFVSNVSHSRAIEKGVKRGDQLLNVNGQNFEKLELEKAYAILKKNTDLTMTVKTNLFAFKAMVSDLTNPAHLKQMKNKKDVLSQQSATLQAQKVSKFPTFGSETDAYDGKVKKDCPEDVIKVFKADQTFRFIFVNLDTTAEEAVSSSCKEFGILGSDYKTYSLCRVTVQNETFVKQSKLPDKWSNLSDIALSARYYLKNDLESEQLLPDENIPDLLKEANYSFLDLDCFEVALQLTIQDYELFRTVEQTDFIDDLFKLNESALRNFKSFENLVNKELFWVVSTICMESNILRRSKMIKHFTKIAHHCKSLKNLNSTFAIISGLGYRAVSRMRSSWEKVPMKIQRTFEDLQSLMDPSRNMSKYRTLLSDMASQPPVIPYVPVIKKDLTFLHLGNDTKVDGLVNFEKMRMMGREIRNVCRLCSAESSQIFSSTIAPNADGEKSNIYQTLTRKNRRSSFSNARKMYEDAVNARRVKQYMSQLTIEMDEDRLMEMSKQVEPASVASTHIKRKEKADSPSHSSKTLPHGSSLQPAISKAHSQGRNNSEPQIHASAGMLAQVTRRKSPASSLPKFGTRSPQAIKKLLSLSEESDSNSFGKQLSKSSRGESSNSRDTTSPHSSPNLHSTHEAFISKGSVSSSDSSQSLANENTNNSNNKYYGRPYSDFGSRNALSYDHRQTFLGKSISSPHLVGIIHHSSKGDEDGNLRSYRGSHVKNTSRRYSGKQDFSGSRESLNSGLSVDGHINHPHSTKRESLSETSRNNMNSSNSNIDSFQKSMMAGVRQDDVEQTFLYGSRGQRDTPITAEKFLACETTRGALPLDQHKSMKFDAIRPTDSRGLCKNIPFHTDIPRYQEYIDDYGHLYLKHSLPFHEPTEQDRTNHCPLESHGHFSRSPIVPAPTKDSMKNSFYMYFNDLAYQPIQSHQSSMSATGKYSTDNLVTEFLPLQPSVKTSPIYKIRGKPEDALDDVKNTENIVIHSAANRFDKKELNEEVQRNLARDPYKAFDVYPSQTTLSSEFGIATLTKPMTNETAFLEESQPLYEALEHYKHLISSPGNKSQPFISRPIALPLHQTLVPAMHQHPLYSSDLYNVSSSTQIKTTECGHRLINSSLHHQQYCSQREQEASSSHHVHNSVLMMPCEKASFPSSPKKVSKNLPRQSPRRKSQEWSVTDLDKENQRLTMQEWTRSYSVENSKHHHRLAKDNSTWHLNKELNDSLNHRVGSINLIDSSPSGKLIAGTKGLLSGVIEDCDNKGSGKKRTLPSYNEAVSSSLLPSNSELPRYEDLEVLKEDCELASHV